MRRVHKRIFQRPCKQIFPAQHGCILCRRYRYHPYFSTDTATVLRAIEIEADEILLAKAVDGVYDSDPKTNPDAKKFDEISIQEVIEKDLKVVDMTASILCKENKMPMLVFGLNEENSIVNAANGKINGTRVTV